MRHCPKCRESSLEFDPYFGRYRCFSCGWMASSSTEREIRLLEENSHPEEFFKGKIPSSDLVFTAAYDKLNDALLFDFGIKEPTYDLPEPDGRVIWKAGALSDMMAGVVILKAKELDVSEVRIKIGFPARKEAIEGIVKSTPGGFAAGRATRSLIDKIERVELHVKSIQPKDQADDKPFNDAFEEFKKQFATT
jgi:hypothetical protein